MFFGLQGSEQIFNRTDRGIIYCFRKRQKITSKKLTATQKLGHSKKLLRQVLEMLQRIAEIILSAVGTNLPKRSKLQFLADLFCLNYTFRM
jgi:hypothetical protein